jgi:hypothetical protein
MVDQVSPDVDPTYLFLRERVNRFGRLPYSAASLHGRLSALTERLQLTDSMGRPVRISKTHRFRHTRATNLLNAGVPLHVVMRHFGHVTPAMTMHYAQTLSETAEREFLRYKKVTADGRPLELEPSDLYDVLNLDQRADRILPNGWCMLPPKQTCSRGNACLTCDKFVTDVTHRDELRQQFDGTVKLIDRRKQIVLARYGRPCPKRTSGSPREAQSSQPSSASSSCSIPRENSTAKPCGAPECPPPTPGKTQGGNHERLPS